MPKSVEVPELESNVSGGRWKLIAKGFDNLSNKNPPNRVRLEFSAAGADEEPARGVTQASVEHLVKFAVDRNATSPSALGGPHVAEFLPHDTRAPSAT